MPVAQTAKTSATLARLIALLNVAGMKTLVDAAGVDARLLGLGLVDACSRCSGGGSYGPQCVKGGVCFKCGGSGKQGMRHTEALIARVSESVESGALAEYAARMQAAAAARRAVKGAYDAVSNSYKDTAWCRHFYGTAESRVDGLSIPGYPLAWSLHDMTGPAKEAALQADFVIRFGRGNQEAVDACLAAVAEYAKAYETLDRAHAVCLKRGLYEQATAEHLAAKSQDRFSHEAELRSRAKWAKVAAEIWAEVGGE
jgi:hypothetical protein